MSTVEKIGTAFRNVPLLGWFAAVLLLLLSGALLIWAGMPSGPTVSGTVRLDGQPLPNGWIRFIPQVDTPGPDAGAAIEEGKYRIEKGLTVGEYRVEIHGTQKSPKKLVHTPFPGGNMIPAEVAIVPTEYNQNSKLTSRVTAGANTIHFDVEGFKGKGPKSGK